MSLCSFRLQSSHARTRGVYSQPFFFFFFFFCIWWQKAAKMYRQKQDIKIKLFVLSRGPHSHRTRGYLYMLVPHNPNPPISGIGYHWQLQKKTPPFLVLSGNLPETTAKKYPPFPRKWNAHAAPLCIRVGGGGGRAFYSPNKQASKKFIVIPKSISPWFVWDWPSYLERIF